MTILEVIGHNLSKYRRECGYTQEELANELDMSACNIRKIEHGQANPRMQTLIRLANHLNVTMERLFQTDADA